MGETLGHHGPKARDFRLESEWTTEERLNWWLAVVQTNCTLARCARPFLAREAEVDAAVLEGAERIGCGYPIMGCMYQSMMKGTLELTPTFVESILAAWRDQHAPPPPGGGPCELPAFEQRNG